MAERQFGPYRLVRQVAVGGMAEIHLAMTKGIAGFEKFVALKMIHPNFAEDEQFIQMLVDEAKIAVQLTHGNIAQTFDLGRVGDTYYITMEFVDGADLYKILRRGSEIDVEMPVDVCAFIAKEIAAALDYAHRKRDHVGKPLGIVHRDVSPQNVLISYSGEVKLVDFGIAKATMKARQTAVGVIKGKYYYMSPEQAWGDPIDARSDIFSAGIVLYEMLTGQMLYLEEDLHKLLDMARKADIAPPSTLRKGIPPQLERIVMHALTKSKEERYQSAGDFASDLERFLHAYSPVFTAGKVAGLLKKIIGDPATEPEQDPEIEVRDGPLSTGTLTLRDEDLIHDGSELRDENSVIFRVAELKPPAPAPAARPKPVSSPAPRVTRPADPAPPRPAPAGPAKIPKIAPPAAAAPKPAPAAKPRAANQETNLLPKTGPVWEDTSDDDLENVGEQTMIGAPPNMQGAMMMDGGEDGLDATAISRAPSPPDDEDDGLGGGTLLSAASGPGIRTEDIPLDGDDTENDDDDAPTHDTSSEDGPTLQRDPAFAKPRTPAKRASAPPALAAKIHAPAVSELRKPRASRKTPAGGLPAQPGTPPRGGPNVLQQIVGSRPGDAMPAPMPSRRNEDSNASTLPQQPSPVAGRSATPPHVPLAAARPTAIAPAVSPESIEASMHETVVGLAGKSPLDMPTPVPAPAPAAPQPVGPAPVQYNGYATDASGMPLGLPTPPVGSPVVQPGYPQAPQGYPGYPNQQQPPFPGYAMQQPVSPGALYQFQPSGAPPPQPMSLTGQLRLFEADALPDKYKLQTGGKWIKLVVAAVLAIAVAAGGTYLVMRALRADAEPTFGSVHVESAPAGADVYWDNVKVGKTPITVDNVPVDSTHEVRLEAPGHKSYKESVRMPKHGGEVPVTGLMQIITGKIRVVSTPDGAEIRINGEPRGRTPMTIPDIDMATAKTIELRLRDYEPYIQNLEWPPNGEIDIERKLTKSAGH